MHLGFSYIGLLWLAMLIVPNLFWRKHKPGDYEKISANENKLLLAMERTGEVILSAAALIFSDFNFKGRNFWCAVLLLSFFCMLLYEIYWLRYFKSEKTAKDLYRNLLGIPLAGATLPVAAFFLLGIYGGNGLMLLAAVIFGIGHIGLHLSHKREAFGAKSRKTLGRRILGGIPKVIVSALLIIVTGFFAVAIFGKNITQISRAFEYREGINKSEYVMLNGQEQYILTMGHDTSNPVIISLHGGPGAPTTSTDYCWLDYLTDDHTVVCWDQRGCGRTYYHNAETDPDNSTLSFEQAEKDLDALVDFVCGRFEQEKVIIMGHSYGSLLGSQYTLDYPHKVSHYIGIGQEVMEENWRSYIYGYEDSLKKAKELGHDTTEMEAIYETFLTEPNLSNINAISSVILKYHPARVTEDVSAKAMIFSPYFGIDDARWYLLLLKSVAGDSSYETLTGPLEKYLLDFNAYKRSTDFLVPTLFISGSEDWSCPVDFVKEYFEVITAPRKEIYLLDGCGHSPQSQLPEEFAVAVKDFIIG